MAAADSLLFYIQEILVQILVIRLAQFHNKGLKAEDNLTDGTCWAILYNPVAALQIPVAICSTAPGLIRLRPMGEACGTLTCARQKKARTLCCEIYPL